MNEICKRNVDEDLVKLNKSIDIIIDNSEGFYLIAQSINRFKMNHPTRWEKIKSNWFSALGGLLAKSILNYLQKEELQ